MPELPEVETVCRGLNRLTLGQILQGGEVLHPSTLAYPLSVAAFQQALTGLQFQAWQRRGKYLLGQLINPKGQSASVLGIHLRMTGQLLWVNQAEMRTPHTRLCFPCQSGQELRFIDIRTFGRIWYVLPGESIESVITGLKRLGPEPFSPDFSPAYLQSRLGRSQRPLKTALLDQGLVAGLGNIYADEVLFQSGILPTRTGSQLQAKYWPLLHQTILQVLETAIAAGGTTFSNFLDPTGINGNYGGQAWVYGRKGETCRVCDTPIERIKLAGRSSHFCPTCQR
ncbi:DNA-formamidopyrimidine glycosylase [Synechocystis sp. LKSZ1]|uniref:DNA-formamidopyrimidine glycosylase n=1 Tax=Synechocystis sp. LKSZ1 TaxID=3144951 RepID=UPI00336BCBD6